MKPRFSYANIVSTLALALALGGGVAVAADELAKNSVGTKQLKNNAVVGKKVKDGSLLAVDFGAGQLPAGPVGPIGPQGPRGLQGVPGSPGSPGAPGADAAAYFSYYNDSGNMAAWTCYNLNLTHSIFKVGDTVLLAPNYGGGVPNYFQVSAGRSVANGAVPITVCNMSPNPVGASTFRVDIWRVVGPSGSRPAPEVRVEGDR